MLYLYRVAEGLCLTGDLNYLKTTLGSCNILVIQPITLKDVAQEWVHDMNPMLLLGSDLVMVCGCWFISESGS